jgi:NAD(P)-dependent dehydrogenase (short-subunit alcohol dehydrogenase family)
MRTHPRKEAGIVVDFVPKAATHNERVVSLHSLLDADFYREGARVTPAPRRRVQRRARRKLTPAPWLVPVTPDVRRRLAVITREWQRVDPKYLDDEEQRYWATIAGRQIRFDERAAFVEKLTARGASKGTLEQFLATCAAENPNRRLRIMALSDRVSMTVERADFDDLVTLITQAPTWEKDRMGGVRILLRAISEGKADAPEQILARWTWRLARASRKLQDRRASAEFPEAKRLLGALANSRGHRHEENAAKLVAAALTSPREVGAALLARGVPGSLVTLSSQMGAVGFPGRAAYCATKHAVDGLTRALAVEWAAAGVRVNAVAPTFVHTPLTAPMLADPGFRADVLGRLPTRRLRRPLPRLRRVRERHRPRPARRRRLDRVVTRVPLRRPAA